VASSIPKPGESLADLYPDLVAQWHPTKNDTLPSSVKPGSHRRVWWSCTVAADHEWEAPVKRRAGGSQCPFCAGQRPSSTNNFADHGDPTLLLQWHQEKNEGLGPQDFTRGSSAGKVWWRCSAGPDHEWQATIYNRVAGAGCPFCAGQRPSSTNNFVDHGDPGVVAEWHPTLNGDLEPAAMTLRSGRKVWWKCSAGPDHEWQATISSRTSRGSGCPFCDGKRVSVTNSLASTASSKIIEEWHPTRNGGLTPADVVAGSHTLAWWLCRKCGHEWKTQVALRGSSGHGCRRCSAKAVQAQRHRPAHNTSLAALFPEIASEWHPSRNGDSTPEDFKPRSNKTVWWQCGVAADHEWQAIVNNRVGRGSNCPYCAGRLASSTNNLQDHWS